MWVTGSSAAIRMMLGCERRQCEVELNLALLFYMSLGDMVNIQCNPTVGVIEDLTVRILHSGTHLTREKQREYPSSSPKIGRVDKGLIHSLIPYRLFHLQPDAQYGASVIAECITVR